MVLKRDPGATVEKDLIVEAVWHADGPPTAGISMDAGTEAVSNVAIVSGNKRSTSQNQVKPYLELDASWQIPTKSYF